MDFIILFTIILLLGLFGKMMDSMLGLGYGTLIVPILIIAGHSIQRVVPAVLISEFLASGLTAIFHRLVGNISGDVDSPDFKVSTLLSVMGVVGAIIGVTIVTNLSELFVVVYVGLTVIITGMLVVQRFRWYFSWKKITVFGLIASFNKALSGGGYGTIIAGGQILSGRDTTKALGTTSVAEAVTTGTSWLLYFLFGYTLLTWQDVISMNPFTIISIFQELEIPLIIGALLSAPISVYFIKTTDSTRLTPFIGVAAVAFGIFAIVKSIGGFDTAIVITGVIMVLFVVIITILEYRNKKTEIVSAIV